MHCTLSKIIGNRYAGTQCYIIKGKQKKDLWCPWDGSLLHICLLFTRSTVYCLLFIYVTCCTDALSKLCSCRSGEIYRCSFLKLLPSFWRHCSPCVVHLSTLVSNSSMILLFLVFFHLSGPVHPLKNVGCKGCSWPPHVFVQHVWNKLYTPEFQNFRDWIEWPTPDCRFTNWDYIS